MFLYLASLIKIKLLHHVFDRVVRDIKDTLLTITFKYVYPLGGLKHLDKILFAVIELQVRDVDNAMESCVVDILSLMSVCENVCALV